MAASKTERSFIMVKPDGVQRGLIGEIVKRFEQRGFKLVAMKFLKVRGCPIGILGVPGKNESATLNPHPHPAYRGTSEPTLLRVERQRILSRSC